MSATFFIDQGQVHAGQEYHPFALTDVLTEYVGEKNSKILHFWQLQQTMILGMKDTRLPYLSDGIVDLLHHNYQPVIRNAGGLGVIADSGILNISLFLPNQNHLLTVEAAYEEIFHLTQQTFPETDKIKAFEISDSYCPGKFDLSIDGKKFAGIAQRRVKNGVAVMMYMSVTGPQSRRGEVVKSFYQAGLKEQFGTLGYPKVNPKSMENLTDLLGLSLSVKQIKSRLIDAFDSNASVLNLQELLNQPQLNKRFTDKLTQMIQRNELLQEVLLNESL